eukprot:5781471-Amphidinium_carterae.1
MGISNAKSFRWMPRVSLHFTSPQINSIHMTRKCEVSNFVSVFEHGADGQQLTAANLILL